MATQQYIKYTTKDGDRLDLIAFECYGNDRAIQLITDANPNLPIRSVYEAGLELRVPVKTKNDVLPPNSLPPWKR